MRALFFIVVFVLGLGQLNAQEISENDSLPSRFILILPTADNSKLTLIKNEFAKYPQIQSAVFVYKNHNALLIEMADMVNTRLVYYREIMKVVTHGVKYEEILIKHPSAYEQVIGDAESNSSTFIVK